MRLELAQEILGRGLTNKKGSFELQQEIVELFEVGSFESVLPNLGDSGWENCISTGTTEEESASS